MPVTELPITNGFYVSPSLPLSAQECTNWYVNVNELPAASQENLFGTPGLRQVATTGTQEQATRGSAHLRVEPYFINGTNLYRLNPNFTLTTLGVIPGTGRVSVAENGTQLCIVVPGNPSRGFIFTTNPDTLTEIADADWKANGEPQQVAFIDGYFVFTTNTKKFICSALNDGLAYNALDFGTAEADPDDTVAPIVFNNQLFIGGSQTLEAFQNVGGSGFPFKRAGLYVPKGIAAPFSVVNASNTFMFIGGGYNEGAGVWAFEGNAPTKISTAPIDTILQELIPADLAKVFAWSYSQRGAYFIGFTLPKTSLVYDMTSQRWHERKSQVVDARGTINTQGWRLGALVTAYSLTLASDQIDGRIGVVDPDVYTEYGRPITRVVATQPFQNNTESFTVPSIELTMEAGVGNDEVANPVIRMDRSLDGKRWKDDRTRMIGKKGEYTRRTIWRRNGRAARFEIFRFTLTDPVKPVIIKLTADMV
jgi:Phage stabilisation protein